MTDLAKICAYLAAVIIGGAFLAPLLYFVGVDFVDAPFGRYFDRAVLVVAVVLLWPTIRWLGLKRWTDLSLEPNPHRIDDLRTGIAVAVVGGWLIAAGMLLSGAVEFRSPFRWWGVVKALGTGVAVALIEETFFRGGLLGLIRRRLPWQRALIYLSVLFALVHFVKPHSAVRAMTDVGFLSGFAILRSALHRFADPVSVLIEFIPLVLFGWILGYTVVRTRSLYMAMGLHGGWVFALRSLKLTTVRLSEPSVWIGKKLKVGIVPMLLLLLTLVILVYILRRRQPTAA